MGAYHKRSMGNDAVLTRVAALLVENGAAGEAGLLVGVSGGPDSVALLHILNRLRQGGSIKNLYAAHMNHGIRGTSADEDAAFVNALCRAWDIPLFEKRVDAIALSRQQDMTLEEAAREARYAFLRSTRVNCGAAFIVTAHHRDDQAETILLHLLRGAGLSGLCGMQIQASDILRPLLTSSRDELLGYISQNGLSYRTDESNMEPGCLRNRVRLELLPFLRRNYNPSITESLCRMAELLSEDEMFLHETALCALVDAKKPGGGYDCVKLRELPKALQSRAVRMALEHAGALYDMQRGGIESVCMLLNARTGARMELPRAMEARVSYESLFIGPKSVQAEAFEMPFAFPGEILVPQGRFFSKFADTIRVDEGDFVAYMDADKLPRDIVIRRRRPGDRFYPLGAPGSRKLKEYLIDKKKPRDKRNAPLLAAGAEVLFFPGGTVSHTMRVGKETTRILRVEYIED